MRTRNFPVIRTRHVLVGFLVLGLIFVCLLTGLMAAVVPPGTLVRLVALPIISLGMLALWSVPKSARSPDRFLNQLLWLLVALIHLWPAYIVYRFGGMPSINPTKLAWLALLSVAGLAISSCQAPMARLARRCRAHKVLVGTVLFLGLWRIISAASGEQPIAQVLQMGPEIVSCYVIFFVALAVLRDERDVFLLLGVLTCVALLQVVLASYESVVKHTLFARFVSVSAEDSAVMLEMLRDKFRDAHYRAQGTFEHPMVLAEFMAMMVPLAAALFLTRKEFLLRWASAGFIPLAIVMIVASRSRAGVAVLMIAVLLVVFLLLLPRDRPGDARRTGWLLVAAALLLPLLLGGGYLGMQEFSSLVIGRSHTEAGSTMARVVMLERGIPLIISSPIVGYGYGMGAVHLGLFDGVRFNIDNYWLSVALDSGIPGLGAFLTLFVGSAVLGAKVYRRRADHGGTAAGLIAVSLLMLLITKTVLSISSGLTLGYILICAIIVLAETSDAPGKSRSVEEM